MTERLQSTLSASHRLPPKSGWTRKLLMGALFLLTTILLLDPGDKLLHIKVPCFFLVMLVWLLRVDFREPIGDSRMIGMVVVISLLIPLGWMLLSVSTADFWDPDFLLAYPKALLFLALLFVVHNERIGLDRITARLSLAIAVITICVVIVSKISPVLGTGIYLFASAKDMAVINESRDQFGIGVGQFFYNTSPIMLLGFAYFLHRSLFTKARRVVHLLLTVLLLVALVFSGSRGNLLASLLVMVILFSARIRKSIGVLAAAVMGCVLLVVPLILVSNTLLNPKEESNEVKLAHYRSYADLFAEHPGYLIFGEGEGTRFYSLGFGDYAYITELTYLELIRQFGILATLVLMGLLLAPLIILLRKRSFANDTGYVAAGYLGYLLVSATNPLLVSSTGMLVVVTVWARALEVTSESSTLPALPEPLKA